MFAIGVAITGIACSNERRYEQLEHERIELGLARAISQAIETRLNTNIAILDGVVGLFNASSEVTQEEFAAFYRAVDKRRETLRGIQGVGYAAVVPNNNIPAFEQTIRKTGRRDFTVTPPGPRALTTAIVYLEPSDWRNLRAVGFDMYSQETRREAMRAAADSGEPVLSGPVRLLQETRVKPQVGALLYLAIYTQPNQPFQSSQERMKRLRGWAYSPLRMEDLINGALSTIDDPALEGSAVLIYDGDQPLKTQLLYDNQQLSGSDRFSHPTWLDIAIANRTWLIGVQLGHRGLSPGGWNQSLLAQALLGLSLSSLAAVTSQRLLSNHLEIRKALQREQEASRERALAGTVFDSSPAGIVVTDPNGVIMQVNPAFCQLSGYSELEARGQKTNLLRSGRHDTGFYEQMWSSILTKGYWTGEIWNRHRNGQVMRHDLSITSVFDEQGELVNFVGLLRDVSERYKQEEEVRFMATHDPLTGLANRALMIEELTRSLALARRHQHGVGLLFIDLDNFKPVNDRYGHSAGDSVLKAVGHRLKATVRESDTVCRQGGDEFVVLIPDAPGLEELLMIAQKLESAIRQPMSAREELSPEMQISASIGVARWPDHANNADELLEAADTAMYQAKQRSGIKITTAKS